MENVQIVAYSEREFTIPLEVNEEMLKEKQVAVGINPVLKYKDGTDAIGCQIHVVYTIDGTAIMEYGAVLTVLVDGWKELLGKDPEENEMVAASKEAWVKTIDFVRGAICANATRFKNDVIARLILPPIDIEKFMGSVKTEKVE